LNVIIILCSVQVAKRLDLDDPDVLNIIRSIYIASNLAIAALWATTFISIRNKSDKTELQLGDGKGRLTKITVYEYDRSLLFNAIRKQIFGIVVAVIMHFYLGLKAAMVTQSILPLKLALRNNLVRIHVFQEHTKDNITRPFK
ncbi:inorganic phosphate transporter Pho88, partial [Fusarium sp. MPI-SDFR-AT-0072]